MNGNGRSPEERERARIERERERERTSRGDREPAASGAAEIPVRSSPPASSPVTMRRIAAVMAIAVFVLAIWVLFALFQPLKGEGEGTVAVAVPRGATVGEIGDLLAEREVVGNSFFFGLRARLSGRASEFQSGRFEFGRDMSYAAAIDTLAAKPNAGIVRLTIPEGQSRYEIAQLATNSGLEGEYMQASQSTARFNPRRYGAPRDAGSLEGFLFPATYELPVGATADSLVNQQITAFRNNFAGVRTSYARAKNLTTYDVLTIASLIDREVQKPAERKLVAAVIYNRLKQGIPLGIDATTRFETRNWTEPLTNAQLRSDSPFNTRTRRGLPPTPIGNPGLAAIKAAARPARVPYLYYVANPCEPGTHTFSSTYAEFERDVQRYNKARESAGGKQPSGC